MRGKLDLGKLHNAKTCGEFNVEKAFVERARTLPLQI